ncbi:TetR/AcrR family transcriptional regulator [Streptomyces sp. A012304]|uniref:TetR/AcrR family transcriptional regulator n=1 Tax=Streptomyces sp. A012304 TaxID=375446 RepID=UPI0022317671|nr:TetR/AcrR family transcriptional regulator [Streptomyces sp. A012304]GKQ39019.1 TetR family transcriptional regulator [Streptomyces sp. A012304]
MSESTPNGERQPRTGKSLKAQQRRHEILRIAMDTFATRGYNNASLQEIADRAGVTQAGVLHYFRSKTLLLASVLQLRDDTDTDQDKERPRGLAFLQHLVDTMRRNAEREGIVRLYAVLSAESTTEGHPAQDYFRDRYESLRADVTAALAEAHELGEVRADANLEEAANAIIAVMDGLQIQWLLAPDSVDMSAATDRVITALLADITAKHT